MTGILDFESKLRIFRLRRVSPTNAAVPFDERVLLQTLIDTVPDYIFVKDTASRYVLSNRAHLRQLHATTLADIMGKTDFDFFPEAYAKQYFDDEQRVVTTGQPLIDREEPSFDDVGNPIWVSATKMPLRDADGNIKALIGVIRNITARKQAEEALLNVNHELEARVAQRTAELSQVNAALKAQIVEREQAEAALRESEYRYRTLAESSGVGFWHVAADGRTIYLNPAMRSMLEFDPPQGTDTNFLAFFTADDLTKLQREFTNDERQQIVLNQEITITSKTGIRRDVILCGAPILGADGEIQSYIGTFTDITAHKQATEALRKSEELYRTLATNFPNGAVILFDHDLRYKLIEGSQLAELGLSKESMEGKTVGELFPNLRDILEAHYNTALSGTSAYFEVPYADRVYAVWAVPVRNDKGEIYAGLAMTQDISASKRVEVALRESEERFRQMAEAAFEGIFIHEAGEILDANPAFAAMLGYDRSEIIGKSYQELVAPEARAQAAEYYGSESEGPFEVMALRKDGTKFPVQTMRRMLRYHGRVARLTAVRDITEHKQIEHLLRNARDELEKEVKSRTTELSEANARLEQEIAERKHIEAVEHEQRVLAEGLRDTAAALNSTLNFEEVLDRILANVERVVKHDVGNIMLIESGIARVVRFRGYPESRIENEITALDLPVATTATLQWMMEHKQPIIIANALDYPGWKFGPEPHWLRSYIGVPICLEADIIGFLNLDSSVPNFFTDDHARRLQAFADQAAIAIRNARLYEQAQIVSALQERQRLARDLHDAVSQTLFSASVMAESLPRLFERQPEKVPPRLQELHQLTRGALAEMRTLLHELRPAGLIETPLNVLLRHLVESVMSQTGIKISLEVGDARPFPPDVQVTLYRIAQETLNNVAKHANATHITVGLINNEDSVELRIVDDGRGFDPYQVRPDHFGIGIMRERCASIGAILDINSEIGKGTSIFVHWSDNASVAVQKGRNHEFTKSYPRPHRR
jgi:PAS domain S-box-containing protein